MKSLGGGGWVDRRRVSGRRRLTRDPCFDARAFGNPQLVAMASVVMHGRSVRVQHLCDEQAELPVAENRDGLTFRDVHLVQNLASVGDPLREYAMVGPGLGRDEVA